MTDKVSLCLGTGKLRNIKGGINQNQFNNLILKSQELGIKLLDTADSYSSGDSERAIGKIRSQIKEMQICTKAGGYISNLPRPYNQFYINSKIVQKSRILIKGKYFSFDPRITPKILRKKLEASLRRLSVDSVDIYLLHGIPEKDKINDLVEEMIKIKSDGLARKIGMSIDKTNVTDFRWCDVLQVPYGNHEYFMNHKAELMINSFYTPDSSEQLRRISEMKSIDNIVNILLGSRNISHIESFSNLLK